LIIFELFYRQKEEAVEEMSAISYRAGIDYWLVSVGGDDPGSFPGCGYDYRRIGCRAKKKNDCGFSFLLAIPTMLAGNSL